MAVQILLFRRVATHHAKDRIDLQLQLAEQQLLFEVYDSYDATLRLENFINDEMVRPDDLLDETRELLKYYPQFFSCYAAFPENYLPSEGRWFCPCSYRLHDSIYTIKFGNGTHDYFTREWYTGALESDDKGYWTQPYEDIDFDEIIFTYARRMKPKQKGITCVLCCDFSVSWVQHLLDRFKPFDDAVLYLYNAEGELLVVSGEERDTHTDQWFWCEKTLQPIGIHLKMAIPKRYIWQSIRMGILLPFGVFVLGIFVVAFLISRLLRDLKERAQLELVERELKIAHDIQMGILKGKDGWLDEGAVHARLIPMHDVGGDLYDFHREGDNLWFIIGDVSGKGVPAALFMSATVKLFRAAVRHLQSPKELMEEMNVVISENNPLLTFVTVFIGKLNTRTGKLVYCNAGHCEPIINGERFLDCEPNIPLGYDGSFVFAEQETRLAKGETIVLYTDGITEARNSERQMLGKQRWLEIVQKGGYMIEAVMRYIGDAAPTDDITLMTVRHS